MVAKLVTRLAGAICVGGLALGMSAAVAQETTVAMQYVKAGDGERSDVITYSDPETEVGNGTNPPYRVATGSEAETDDDVDSPLETDNFPETEVGNAPTPDLNP